MPITSKLPLKKKKINTVHNLITFSIVFTNKNGGGVDSTKVKVTVHGLYMGWNRYQLRNKI